MASRLDTMTSTPAPGTMQSSKHAGPAVAAPSNGSLIKRLQSELMTLMTSPTPGITAFPTSATDMTQWSATVLGPSGTPYENLTFKLNLSFPPSYPLAPPEVTFRTPIYHPNVDMAGRICLDILKPAGQGKEGAWSAALNTGSVLLSIQSLLGEPNNSSPLNGEAALLWDRDQVEFKRKVLARHQQPVDLDV